MKHLSKVTKTEDGIVYALAVEISSSELIKAFHASRDPNVNLQTLKEFRESADIDRELAFLRILVHSVDMPSSSEAALQLLGNRPKKKPRKLT